MHLRLMPSRVINLGTCKHIILAIIAVAVPVNMGGKQSW